MRKYPARGTAGTEYPTGPGAPLQSPSLSAFAEARPALGTEAVPPCWATEADLETAKILVGALGKVAPPEMATVDLLGKLAAFKTANGGGGLPPVLYGMEVPAAVTAVGGVDDDNVFVDVEGTFPADGPAQHWETEWPTLQHKLSTNPLVMLGGFSPLLSHATLTRDGHSVRLHLSATHEETLRLLALALHMLGG